MINPGATVVDVAVNRTEEAGRRRRLRAGVRGGRGHHPGPRRRRPHDRLDAAGEHGGGRRAKAFGRDTGRTAGRSCGRASSASPLRSCPAIGEPHDVTQHARALVGSIDAANVTDNPVATPHMSAVAGVRFVAAAGVEPRSSWSVATGTAGDHRGSDGGMGTRRTERVVLGRRSAEDRGPCRRPRRERPDRSDLVGLAHGCARRDHLAGAEIGDPPRYLIGVADVPLPTPTTPPGWR